MADPQYLSNDPKAGTTPPRGYLSVDPNAGEPVPTKTTPPRPFGAFTPQELGQGLVDAGPMIGGGIGGIVGGPLGAVAGGAGGSLVKQLINAVTGQTTTPVSPLGAATTVVGEGALQGALEGAGQLVTKGLGAAGKSVYRGYLKPSLAAKNVGKAEQIVQTAIDEALPMTTGGAQKAQGLISGLNKQVRAELAKNPGTVDLHQIAERVRSFAKGKYYKPGVADGDYEAALRVADSIDKHASLNLPAGAKPTRVDVPLTAAQDVKQSLQASAKAGYGVQSNAATTAQKVGASETRAAIEAKAPVVGALNARESKLIDAARSIAAGAGRDSNVHKLYGARAMVGGTVGGAAGYARNQDPYEGAAGSLAVVLGLHPAVASRLAIVAARLGQRSGAVPATVARVALQAVLETDQSADQRQQAPREPEGK